MQEAAYAKLNLALHVRAREPDGYHRIETLFAFCTDGDLLGVGHGDDLSLDVQGPFAGELKGGDNLVLRAAEALRGACGLEAGAALYLDKRLPVAAGIGGGSADAAAALRLLRRWWGLEVGDEVLTGIAARLGADVPACVRSRTARGEGRGDRLIPRDTDLAGTPVLLVNPRVALSTASVFKTWDGIDRGPLGGAAYLGGRNDLEAPAIALVPLIEEVLAAIRPGAALARMSGSGATCFGLYEDAAGRAGAADRIRAAHPEWWILETQLR